MPQWLDKFYHYETTHVAGISFVLFSLLVICLLVSRRMNSRVEAAAPAPRRLRQLAETLLANENTPKKNTRTDWLLRKSDWLLYDKLKLLPDARTGRRLNFFLMLLAALLVSHSNRWLLESQNVGLIASHRNNLAQYTLQQAQAGLWQGFAFNALYIILMLLPFILVRKNREFYFDFYALLILLYAALIKINCWPGGCCFGIPWPWGIRYDFLDTTVFPIQLVEFAFYILGAVLCICYMLYAKSYRPGYGCSVCMISYAVTRFFADYLRYHGEGYRLAEANGLFGLTIVQVFCVAGIALAIIWPFVIPLEKKLLDRLAACFHSRRRSLGGS